MTVTYRALRGVPIEPALAREDRPPAASRELLISRFMLEHTEPLFALGYEFDLVLRGRRQTPTE